MLAGGEITERQVCDAAEADRFGCLADADAGLPMKIAEEIAPEGEVLRDGQFGLHRITMAEIMTGFARSHTGFGTVLLPGHSPAFGSQKACHGAQ
ncbi:hypothetical protein D3C73_1077700 [compost metagenome]